MKFPDLLAILSLRSKDNDESIPLKNRDVSNGVKNSLPYTKLNEADKSNLNKLHQQQNEENEDIGEAEETKLVDKDKATKEPMSPLRKFFFFLSINCWVLYILAFAWLLPCKIFYQPPADGISHNWSLRLSGLEISTNLEVFPGEDSMLVVFGYSGNKRTASGGVVGIDGVKGQLLWQLPVDADPTRVRCGLTTTDGSNSVQCIVMSDSGHLAAVNASNGTLIWTQVRRGEVSTAVISDCNDDGMNDLAVVTTWGPNTTVDVVAAATGDVLHQPTSLDFCTSTPSQLVSWRTNNRTELVVVCSGARGYAEVWSVSDEDLCEAPSQRNPYSFQRLLYSQNSEIDKILVQPVSVNASEGEPVLLVLDSQSLIAISNENITWETPLNSSGYVRKLLSGHFSNNSAMEISVVSDADNESTVSIYNLYSGQLDWSAVYKNGTIVNAVKLSSSKEDRDMLLLKTLLSDSAALNCQSSNEQLPSTRGLHSTVESIKPSYCQEAYVLLDLSADPPFQEVLRRPWKPTAAMVVCDVNKDGVSELLLADRQMISNNASSVATYGTDLELLRLNFTTASKTCNS